MPDATYWNSKKKQHVPYPPIIIAITRAMLDASNDCLDGHVRKTTWEEIQDARYGYFAMAIAAYKVMNPGFELEGVLW